MSYHSQFKDCKCPLCKQANERINAGKPKRFLPKHVRDMIQEKQTREEAQISLAGKMYITCPKCKHSAYMQIGPVIWCPHCAYEIK